jgi:hypothetical protein
MRWLDDGPARWIAAMVARAWRAASASATTAMPSPIGATPEEAPRADCFSRRLTASLQVFI